jgi:hypothetical protein
MHASIGRRVGIKGDCIRGIKGDWGECIHRDSHTQDLTLLARNYGRSSDFVPRPCPRPQKSLSERKAWENLSPDLHHRAERRYNN